MRPSRNGVNALWRILQAEKTVDAPHINLALDAAPGEAGMNGKVDGRTIRGLLGVGVEGLMTKAAAGSSLRCRLASAKSYAQQLGVS